jgi:hypothetical protein
MAVSNGHLPNSYEEGEDKPMLVVKKSGDGPGITALLNRQLQGKGRGMGGGGEKGWWNMLCRDGFCEGLREMWKKGEGIPQGLGYVLWKSAGLVTTTEH